MYVYVHIYICMILYIISTFSTNVQLVHLIQLVHFLILLFDNWGFDYIFATSFSLMV